MGEVVAGAQAELKAPPVVLHRSDEALRPIGRVAVVVQLGFD